MTSVDKALKILDLLAEEYQGLRISEIAKEAKVPYTTAHRLVTTLEANGYVQGNADTGRYMLSLKILQLYRGLNHRMNLSHICFPHLNRLMEKHGETVHLAVLNDGEVAYLDTVVSSKSLAMYTEVGKRVPIHCTALGKALSAHLPAQQVLAILESKGMEARTPNTIVSPDRFLEELATVRELGYATDDEEVSLGVRCVASSVINHDGQVVAAISLSAPTARLPWDDLDKVATGVVSVCNAVSRDLGATKQQLEEHQRLVG